MVEVNCETDFVARNQNFQQFVEDVSIACRDFVSQVKTEKVTKISLNSDELKGLKTSDGKTLGDHLALMIGTVGENASLRRAICFKTIDSIKLSGYTHPTTTTDVPTGSILFGKYGAVLALKLNENSSVDNVDLKKNLCQHIVGMNPVKLGVKDVDEPNENKDEETCLIHQEFLLDPSVNVGELLEENQIEIVDFQRFECGQSVGKSDDNKSENLSSVKASN